MRFESHYTLVVCMRMGHETNAMPEINENFVSRLHPSPSSLNLSYEPFLQYVMSVLWYMCIDLLRNMWCMCAWNISCPFFSSSSLVRNHISSIWVADGVCVCVCLFMYVFAWIHFSRLRPFGLNRILYDFWFWIRCARGAQRFLWSTRSYSCCCRFVQFVDDVCGLVCKCVERAFSLKKKRGLRTNTD